MTTPNQDQQVNQMDVPVHIWWFAGEVIVKRKDQETTEVMRLNTPIATNTKYCTSADIYEGNRRLATVAVVNFGLKLEEVLDVFCYGINYLGFQSWNTFRNRPVGTPASEDSELKVTNPEELSVEVLRQMQNQNV